MAFDVYVGDRPLSPEHTTLEQYNVYRLGQAILLNAAFSETIDERLPIRIFAADDLDADGTYEVLRTTAFQGNEIPPLSGSAVSTSDGTLLGYVTSSVAVDQTVSASVVTSPAHLAITLVGGLPSASATTVSTRRVNSFGNVSHVPAIGGRNWVISLRSTNSAEFTLMQTLMINILCSVVKTALAELGVSKTDAEIQTAVVALAQRGITIDSMIVDGLEILEKGRRDGSISPNDMTISGTPPIIS